LYIIAVTTIATTRLLLLLLAACSFQSSERNCFCSVYALLLNSADLLTVERSVHRWSAVGTAAPAADTVVMVVVVVVKIGSRYHSTDDLNSE